MPMFDCLFSVSLTECEWADGALARLLSISSQPEKPGRHMKRNWARSGIVFHANRVTVVDSVARL